MRVRHAYITAASLCLLACTGNEAPSGPAGGVVQLDERDVVLTSHCAFMAAGMLPSGDRFGGSVRSLASGNLAGGWHHVTAGGDRFEAETFDLLGCFTDAGGSAGMPVPAPNRARLNGTARWNGVGGHTFALQVEDRGEPTDRDVYILIVVAPDGALALDARGFVAEGEVQILGEAIPIEP